MLNARSYTNCDIAILILGHPWLVPSGLELLHSSRRMCPPSLFTCISSKTGCSVTKDCKRTLYLLQCHVSQLKIIYFSLISWSWRTVLFYIQTYCKNITSRRTQWNLYAFIVLFQWCVYYSRLMLTMVGWVLITNLLYVFVVLFLPYEPECTQGHLNEVFATETHQTARGMARTNILSRLAPG
jgi:hypothetical protein